MDPTNKQPTVLTNLQRGNVKQEQPALVHQRTLHELAAQGELVNVDLLTIDQVDSNNMTPLFWAAGYGQSSTTDLLLNSGANPNYKSTHGKTALMLASSRGHYHVVRILLAKGANVNEADDHGNSSLIYAADQDHGQVVQQLLKFGADLTRVNGEGQTAYSIAIRKNNKNAVGAIETHILKLLRGLDHINNQPRT